MASRPQININELQRADDLMGDIVSKFDSLAKMEDIKAFRILPEELDKIDKKFASINKAVKLLTNKSGQAKWKEYTNAVKANRKEYDQAKKTLEHYSRVKKAVGKLSTREQVRVKEAVSQMKGLNKQYREQLDRRKAMGQLAKQQAAAGIDFIGGSALTLGISAVLAGMRHIASGIEKVYDLQEKWTAAVGTFRKAIGPATQDSKEFEKTAGNMHMELYKLGMGFEAAHVEMANFVKSFGFANKEAETWSRTAIEFGVATGAGTEAIGELSRNLMLMGVEQDKQKGYFTEMIGAANAAGVSVADFTKELHGSKESLAEFGETGQKMFIGAASWAKKLGVSIKSLQNIIKLTDTFESTANAAAKMNTVFGTSINSMDLMLEQDPAKRFNMLRDSMIGVGKDMKNLGRLEKRLVSENLGLTMEETNTFLKSGQDYNKFMAMKQKKEEDAAKATEDMHKLMRMASTTMFEWGAFAEELINKLKPIVDLFMKGLGPGFKNMAEGAQTFGNKILETVDIIVKNIMGDGGAKDTIEGLGQSLSLVFKEILNPDNVRSFVEGLKGLFVSFGNVMTAITKFAASPAIKFIAWVIEMIGKIGPYLAGAWAGGKAGAFLGSAFGPMGTVIGGLAGAALGAGGVAVGMAGANTGGMSASEKADKAAEYRSQGMSPQAADARAELDSKHAGNYSGGGGFGPGQAITVGETGRETLLTGGQGGSVIPATGLAVAASAPIILKLHIDSREIQGTAFNTTFPVNVSVVGTA